MLTENADKISYLKAVVRNIPDFPEPGIQFKDITTLLQDAKALKLTSELLAEPFKDEAIDYVLGIESRGFIFGSRLAQDLNAGFILIRKPGKLPAETVKATYELEYGTDSVEMHKDALEKGSRVLIHDDLIATGGSALAVTKLAEQVQATVAGYSFIIELANLNGTAELPVSVKKSVLMKL